MKLGNGIKDRDDKSSGIEIRVPEQLFFPLPPSTHHRRQRGLQDCPAQTGVLHAIHPYSPHGALEVLPSSSATCFHLSDAGLPRLSHTEILCELERKEKKEEKKNKKQ